MIPACAMIQKGLFVFFFFGVFFGDLFNLRFFDILIGLVHAFLKLRRPLPSAPPT